MSNTQKKFDELSRREKRYIRRQQRRIGNLEKNNENITLEQVYTFDKLYDAGKKCCNGVRWKQSTQNFERQLLRRTSKSLNRIKLGIYKFNKYKTFKLCERGKTRIIDAPKIEDRQVEKLYTNEVLLPCYTPSMIQNNCASMKGKGLAETFKLLKKDLQQHYKLYGLQGGIILSDAEKFFPNANHSIIYNRHKRYIKDKQLQHIGDLVLKTIKSGIGMPLGVEPSQAEMIALPSALDNYMQCQVGVKGYGHYMDDFYIIVPPGKKEIYLNAFLKQAEKIGIKINLKKTYYIPFTQTFTFCKARIKILQTGKIIMRASKKAIKHDKQKIKILYKLYKIKLINLEDVYTSIEAIFSYLKNYNEHNNILKFNRLIYSLFKMNFKKIYNIIIENHIIKKNLIRNLNNLLLLQYNPIYYY